MLNLHVANQKLIPKMINQTLRLLVSSENMSENSSNLTRTLSQTQPKHHLKYNSEDRAPPRAADKKPSKKTFYYKMPDESEAKKVPSLELDRLYLKPNVGGLGVSNISREDSKHFSVPLKHSDSMLPISKSKSVEGIPSQVPVMAQRDENQLQSSVSYQQLSSGKSNSMEHFQNSKTNSMQQRPKTSSLQHFSNAKTASIQQFSNPKSASLQQIPYSNTNQTRQTSTSMRQHVIPDNQQFNMSPRQISPVSNADSAISHERRPSDVSSGVYSFDVQQIPQQPQAPFNPFMQGSDNQPTYETLQMYRSQLKKTSDPILLLEFSKYLIQMSEQALMEKGTQQQQLQNQKQLQSEALKYIKKVTQNKVSNLNEQQKTAVSEALVFLAECYGSGALNVNVDHEKAFSFYMQASKLNHPQATYRVAVCNELGAGCKKDSSRAVQYFRKSAALGDVAGMYKMGLIMLNGLLGQVRNPREAISWLKRAAQVADDNNPHALHELGLIYEKEGIPNVIPDENYARDLFTQSAFLGYAPSQYRLGYIYEYGTLGCPIDPRRSIAWYTKSAQQGHPDSELALSGWYLTGAEGVLQRSDTEAYLWARKAADKGLAKAEYAVGYYSEMGIGVKKDLEEARRWYVRSASQGNQRSLQRLSELKKIKGKQRKDDENCILM
eukprot:NODE_157_length_16664_cov_0.301781.p1 type:complete len:665 gc:universal NODE_157_length_16664_cov_0.301781:8611-6617(-)